MLDLEKLAERLKGIDRIVGHDQVRIREAIDWFAKLPDEEEIFFFRAYLKAKLEDYGPAKADLDMAMEMALHKNGSIPVIYHGLCAEINQGLGRYLDAFKENFIVGFAKAKAEVAEHLGL